MKALVKAKPEVGLWLQDEPVPEIGPSDVLIRIRKTGICGTDIHIWNWDEWAQRTVPVPMITGHEFAGEIATACSPVRRGVSASPWTSAPVALRSPCPNRRKRQQNAPECRYRRIPVLHPRQALF